MEDVITLVEKGETRKALKRLLDLVKEEHKQEVSLLLANFNAHEIDVREGTQKKDAELIARTNKAIISICDKYEPSTKSKPFAEPPILDNLPLDKEGYLLGRKAALEQLHTSLHSKNILTLVNGMGGIGKSTLASFYANFPKYRATYSHCFWITVSDLTGEIEEALISAFLVALELYQMPKEAQLQKIQAYLRSLDKPVLLIIDNANDEEKVTEARSFLLETRCKVLFTTRANIEGIEAQFLAEMLPEDAFTLFTHYYAPGKDHPQTKQLLANISYHTLLVEFMAKTLNKRPNTTIQNLIEITHHQDFTKELSDLAKFTTHHTYINAGKYFNIQPTKYLLQIFPVDNLNEQEKRILRYFAILPAKWIGMGMLLQFFAADKEKTTHL
ncbi:MAG: NB-ARC domain-containing protein, partial [Bacteroidia bacterium]